MGASLLSVSSSWASYSEPNGIEKEVYRIITRIYKYYLPSIVIGTVLPERYSKPLVDRQRATKKYFSYGPGPIPILKCFFLF